MSRGEAGELGRRRIGTRQYLKNGQRPCTLLPLPFDSMGMGSLSNPFVSVGWAVLAEHQKTCFFECYSELSVYCIRQTIFLSRYYEAS